jgi:O-antigen ligase/polysaccharide polymerase Wzy-like membrane protein
MGLFLACLSLVLSLFSPAELIPSLAPYNVQALIMLPALAYSVAHVALRPSQMEPTLCFVVAAIWGASATSLAIQFRLGNAYDTLFYVGPAVLSFFLIHLNSYSLKRIKIVGGVITASAVVMAVEGIMAYHSGYRAEQLLLLPSPTSQPRIRALGTLNDPNDFAQFLLVALSLSGLFWKKASPVRNLIVLGPPAVILTYAVYLTSSRGAIFGLLTVIVMALFREGRKSFAFFSGVAALILMFATQFGGGRQISLEEGSGRIEAWGAGLAMLKSRPLFGVGFGDFTKHHDITAHNSFVLCFAELGLFGFFFYLAAVMIAGLGLQKLTKLPVKTAEDESFVSGARAVRAAFAAFLVTSWFLSRTYIITFYVLLGLAASMIQMRRQQFPALRLPLVRWVSLATACEAFIILVVYAIVRIRNL